MRLVWSVCVGVCVPPPRLCLLITQICAQSEGITKERLNYASRQRSGDASAETGEGRLNRSPPPRGACHRSA